VRVKRRRRAAALGGKRGDLTAKAEPEVIFVPPPAREPEPALPELLLLPPMPGPSAAFEPPLPPPMPEPPPALPELLLPPLPASWPAPEPALPELLLPPSLEPMPEPLPAPEPLLPELLPAAEAEPAPAFEPSPASEPAAASEAEDDADAAPETDGLDILDYWDSLRGARNVPALDDLDRAYVAVSWPNTLLLAVEQAELPRITRLGENNGEIDYTGMVIDWIMTRGKQSARHAEPMEEEQRFAVSSGSARYRLLLLPMGGDGPACSHVLCQLARIEERGTVASIRRWFTG
jgi:hypothetical protein